jgi:LuxR family maltose regulon positive regulatory protein
MLAERPDQLTIVFDNFQVIENPSIHDALALLFAHLPSQVHVLIASRGAIACPLARLRAAGQVSELGAEALRFTHTEIEQVLLADANSPLEPTEVNTLEQCTEGWIAGVRLLLLARQEQQMQLLPGHITQYHALQSYILEEVLTPQPEPIQSFLLETALLGRVNAALCRAVTGQADGERLLERLERAQLFLFSCREQPGWYRYHPVLTNALRHHQEMTQPEHGALLLRRASRWFEKQGALEQAIEYALAARDHPRAAALVERIAAEVFARGEITTLHHWLDALPGAVVRASPRLCIANVWLVFITSQPEEFLEWVEAAELALSAQRQPLSPLVFGEIQAELVGLRAMYQLSFGEFAKAIAACEQAMAQVPPKNSYLRALLLMVLGFAHLRGVNIRLGAQAMAQASNILQITRHALLLPYVIIGQAESYLAQCDLPHAAACCRQILTLATEQNVPALFSAGLAHGLLGEIFWEWNNLEMARSHALQAWDLATQTQTVKTLLLSSLLLALITHAQGEAQETAYWLRQIESSAPKVGLTERLAFISALRAGFSLKDGHLESALAWMRDYRPSWDELTTLTNEFAQCTQARTLLAAGRAYADKAYAEQALILLERVRTTAEEVGRVRSLLEMLVLQALALQLTGDTTAALEVLGRAVALAESGRYIRLFVSEGDPLARLLRQLLDQQRAQKGAGQTVSLTYLANLLKAFAPVGSLPVSPVAGEPLLDPLSWREHEVLRLIATGRKNREIADELVVVTGTVKAHINTIYQKLGVKSRVQAIVRARSLGLL